MDTTMNLHQPLPSSCYLNNSENSTAVKSNLSSIAPKLQKKKQRSHLGSKTKVDPSLFQMAEKPNEKKMFANSVTDRPRVGIRKTNTKSVSTEEQGSEEENVSQDDSDPQERFKVHCGSDNKSIEKNRISLLTHSVSSIDCEYNL